MPSTWELTSPKTGQTYKAAFDADEPPPEDFQAAIDQWDQEFYNEQGLDPSIANQGNVGTVVNQVANVGPALVGGLLSNSGRVLDAASAAVEGGLVKVFGKNEWTQRGSGFADVANVGDALQYAGQERNPTNPANETANTIGSGIQQGVGILATMGASVPFVGSKAAMTVVPSAIGGVMGAGEGVQTARDMGIENPLGQLALGSAFGAAEYVTEKMGGIGGQAASEAIQQGVKASLGRAGKAILSEAVEEPLAGSVQDVATTAAGQFVEDPKRPGYTTTSYKMPAMDAAMLQRRMQEAIGGAAGGTVFAGLQLAADRGATMLPPTVNPSTPPTDAGQGSSELAQIAARGGRVDTPLEPSTPGAQSVPSAAAPTGLGPTGTIIPASVPMVSIPPATQTTQVPAQTAGLGSLPSSVSAAAPGATLPSANAPTPAGSTQLPSAEQVTPTAPTAAESAIPQSGAALPGSLPATSQPNQSAAQASPGSSAAAALNSAPTSPPTTASQAAAVPQARPATESQRARLRVAERVLTTQGVDQETAAVLASRLAESLPEGLPMEAMRERVLSEFAAAGGTLPGSVPRRYVEDAAAYVGAGYSEQDAAMLAAQSKAANDADVQAAHAKNSQLREVLNRPRVKMSRLAKPATQPVRNQTKVTRDHALSALRYVQQADPELIKNVALVGSRADLNAQNYHPDDWATMEGAEGFFDARTGQTVVFVNQISVREGEQPRRAVMRVIVHEAIGHSGMEALRQTSNPAFAKRWNTLIDQIENDPALSAEIAAIGEQPGYEHLAEDPDGLVEEWFARQIEGMDEAALNAVPTTSTLGQLLQWLKDALAYVASGFSRKTWTAREIREIATLSRQALRDGGPQGVSDGRVKQSRKFNPLHGSDLPNWLRRPLGMSANAPFRVQALSLRALLKGSALPAELLPFARRSERDIAALRQSAAQIGQDLNTAVDAYAKRSGMTLEAAHVLVAKAMETPALLAAMPDPVLKERIRRARNLLDDLSATTAKYTGGDLGAAILKNRGHWMRRAYACFDEASNWTFDNLDAAAKKGQKINGVDAAKILKDARDYITRNVTAQRVAAKEPAPKPGEIEAIMRQMTDKNVWEKSLLGNAAGAGISKDVTSLMHRAAYHPDVMAWLKRNSITNWDYQSIAALAATGGSWEGRNATVTLAAARANLALLHPKATPGEINDMLRQQDIAAPIRALMGEEVNPVKRFLNSASFQAQYIARHEQQTAMRDVGLQIGLFSTNQTGVFTEELGDGRERNGFKLPVRKMVNGKTVLVEETIYTTPEVMAALAKTKITGVTDTGYLFVDALRWIGSEAKLNKVALNPDSWMVNLLGNVMGLVQSGDLISFTPWRNVQRAIELHRSGQTKAGDALDAVREAETDQRRQMLSRLTASGVANSGLEISDIEAGLDNRVLQFIEQSDAWDIAAGGVRGAILGNGLGRPFGIIGQGIGAAIGASVGAKFGGKRIQGAGRKIAEWTTGNPDRFAKLAAFYSNYEAHLAAGMAEQAAFDLATEKTMNTLPDYSKLPALMRELSRLGLMGSFIGFQYEVYRNTYWNAKYAKQELMSGNPALVERGMKRFVGLSGMLALAGAGLAGIIRGVFGAGVDDEKDKAYRRALGAEHERFGTLAYTKLDAEGASFFNTSYLLPQVTLFEVLKAGLEGRDLGESLKNIAKQLTDQFVSGSVHLDPLIAAWTNQRPIGGKVSFEEGAAGMAERVAYFLYVTAEPGALNKEDRLVRAMQGRARYGRQFSIGEELKRFLGIRQNTYTHEERIESRLFRFRDAYNDARSLARTSYRQGDPNAAGALSRANERIAALQSEYDQFQTDLMAIGVPQNKFEQIRKAVGTSRQFAPLIMGEDGPESERVKTRKAYSTDNAPSTSEPSRMTLPPRR